MVGPVSEMNSTRDLLLRGWEIHPTVVAGCAALVAWYFAAPPRRMRYAVPFLLGIAVLCLSLISPLDPLGDEYLFSAHMLQHLLLILIVPPLLIVGLAPERVATWMQRPMVARSEALLGRPLVAWTANMLAMAVWHIPALYNAANAITIVHVVEHLTFLVTGCMFWWPIFSPLQVQRMAPGRAIVYLFGAAPSSVLCWALSLRSCLPDTTSPTCIPPTSSERSISCVTCGTSAPLKMKS